jgi:hypothetical protein
MKKDETPKTEYAAFESALRKILTAPKDKVKKASKAKAKKPKKKS